jgi:ankyrin repeat protein
MYGETALIDAALLNQGYKEAVEILLKAGANPNIKLLILLQCLL